MGLSAHIEMVPWKELLQTSPFMARGAVCFLNPARRSSTKAPSLCVQFAWKKKQHQKTVWGGQKSAFLVDGETNHGLFCINCHGFYGVDFGEFIELGGSNCGSANQTHIPFFEAPQIDLKIRIPRVVKSPSFIQVLSLISATFLGATLTLFHLVSHDFLVSWVSSIGDFSKTTILR